MIKTHNILSQNAFWMVNKNVTRAIGDVRGSLLLSYLIDKESYNLKTGKIAHSEGEDWFYATASSIEDDLCLSYRQQKTVIKMLEDAGVLATKVMGLPAKVHFSLCKNKILQIVNTSISENAILDLAKAQNNTKNTIPRTQYKEHILASSREDADPIDLAFEQTAPVTQKEKSSAKKEKAVTPETAAKRDAFIAEMRGKPAPEPDEPIDVVTDTLRWLTEDPSGKNNWQMIRRTVAAKPEELTDPAATVTSAALMLGTGVTSVPSQFRRRLLGFARTQLKIDRQNSQTPTHAPRNNYPRQPAQPVITREQSVRVAEKILAKRAAARQGVE